MTTRDEGNVYANFSIKLRADTEFDEFDDQVEALIKKMGADYDGSGCGFGNRDHWFVATDKAHAEMVFEALRRTEIPGLHDFEIDVDEDNDEGYIEMITARNDF